jgi:hypothetical protein
MLALGRGLDRVGDDLGDQRAAAAASRRAVAA